MENIPDYVRHYIHEFVANNDFEFADNFRAYRVDAPDTAAQDQAVSRYETAKAEGCCGYYDREHTINGEQWMIGFNYGH